MAPTLGPLDEPLVFVWPPEGTTLAPSLSDGAVVELTMMRSTSKMLVMACVEPTLVIFKVCGFDSSRPVARYTVLSA